MPALYSPSAAKVAKIRSDLAARGIKAHVRRYAHSVRIVLPSFGEQPEVADHLRDYMVETGFCFAGGRSATSADWRHCWTHYAGRAQFFLYDIH